MQGISKRLSYKDDNYVKWFAEIEEGLGIPKIDLLGISLGGFIAHRYASVNPDKVNKLALIVPAGIVQASVLKGIMSMIVPMLKYKFNPTKKNLKELTGHLLSNWDEDWGHF